MVQGAGALKPSKTVRRIIDTLATQHPNADTELVYRNAFELLAATILSAQSTDVRVNMVTPALFKRYPDARALARATPAALEPRIVSTGFFRQKSKALIGMAQQLVAEHGGNVPADMDQLTKLPGVGRKTANVVLGHALGVPGLPVDRHVLRVSNRIGIAEGDDPEAVESQLNAALPKAMWTLTSDVLILHGRRICRPKPLCDQCSVRDDCDYYRLVMSGEPQQVRVRDARITRRGSLRSGDDVAATVGNVRRRGPRAEDPNRGGAAAAAGNDRRPHSSRSPQKHDPRKVRTPRR